MTGILKQDTFHLVNDNISIVQSLHPRSTYVAHVQFGTKHTRCETIRRVTKEAAILGAILFSVNSF